MEIILTNQSTDIYEWFEAAKNSKVETLEALLFQDKVWIDQPNEKGNSALHYAVKEGNLKVVQYLIEKGAHLYTNAKTKSPLDYAVGNVKSYLHEFARKVAKEKEENAYLKKVKAAFYDEEEQIQLAVESLDWLINKRAESVLYEYEKLKKFILLLPKNCHIRPIDHSITSICAYYPDKVLDFLSCIEDEERRTEKTMEAISIVLGFGDFENAQNFADALKEKEHHYQFVQLHIHISRIMIDLMEDEDFRKFSFEKDSSENEIKIPTFSENIHEGLNFSAMQNKGIYEWQVNQIALEMGKCGSFKKALQYANQLENNQERAFARLGLSWCGLEGAVKCAQDLAAAAFEEKMEKGTRTLLSKLEEAKKEKNFIEIVNLLKK